MILAYSSYYKLVYGVTTGHMTLSFEIFWRETVNRQEGNRQVWSGNIYNCTESSDITTYILDGEGDQTILFETCPEINKTVSKKIKKIFGYKYA